MPEMKVIYDKHSSTYRILVGEYKTSARGHSGNYLCDKDGFELRFKQEARAIERIKQFREYLDKKTS